MDQFLRIFQVGRRCRRCVRLVKFPSLALFVVRIAAFHARRCQTSRLFRLALLVLLVHGLFGSQTTRLGESGFAATATFFVWFVPASFSGRGCRSSIQRSRNEFPRI